jgi:DNA-binding response OmpR family regulator
MMPNLDGYEFCQVIRKKTEIPILFLSSRHDDMDKILGLGIGGDDYIQKSTSMSVIAAKVKAHLRRNRILTPVSVKAPAVKKEKSTLEFPGLIIKTDSADVLVNGSKVKLAAKEYQLLCLMARNPQRVYSVDHLFEVIWGENSFGDNRTVMVHLSNLRKKIETGPDTPRFIETIRGIGYKFIEMGDS